MLGQTIDWQASTDEDSVDLGLIATICVAHYVFILAERTTRRTD